MERLKRQPPNAPRNRLTTQIAHAALDTAGKDTSKIKTLRGGKTYVTDLLRSSPMDYYYFREGKYLHVSDLIHKCIRKISLAETNSLTIAPEKFSDSMGLTFAQGVSIHNYVKKKIITGHPTEVFGQWTCSCGAVVSTPETYSKPKQLCEKCGTQNTNYKEMFVPNEEYLISGSIDLLLFVDQIKSHYICEIKSIADAAWAELVRPIPSHLLQVIFYWWLMREAGYTLVDQVSILYVTKGYKFVSPYKEFVIKPEEHIHRLKDHLEDALRRKNALTGGKIPVRVFCKTVDDKEAKACNMAVLCFQE